MTTVFSAAPEDSNTINNNKSFDGHRAYYFTVEVVESQRRYVLTGWTGRARFPLDPYEWADTKGQCSRPTREVDYELPKELPYKCEWVGDWAIYVGTDERDWYKGGRSADGAEGRFGGLLRGRRKGAALRGAQAANTRATDTDNNNNCSGGGSSAHTSEAEESGGGPPQNDSLSAREGGDHINNNNNNKHSDSVLLKYTRFDDDGWEYAFDYHRAFKPQQSSTMSWVRRRYWRRTFVVRGLPAVGAEEAIADLVFPDRFQLCLLESGGFDEEERTRRAAAQEEYFLFRPRPRVTDYKVGLRRLGLKLYTPTANRQRTTHDSESESGSASSGGRANQPTDTNCKGNI